MEAKIDVQEINVSNLCAEISPHQGTVSVDIGYITDDYYYANETPREKEKRDIKKTLENFTNDIEGLEKQAYRKVKESERSNRYNRKRNHNSFVSKKIINRERDNLLKASAKLKAQKEEFYTEHLEYFI